jgi:tetratricopeptide (TPR) repeat protein
MTDEERANWAEAAVLVVNNKFPGGDFYQRLETWLLCGELLLHALSVTTQAETSKVANEQTAILLNQLGVYLRVFARYVEAKDLLERSLRTDEAAFGSDHPKVAIRLNNLASALKDSGDLAQARSLFERALSIFRKFFGDDHPNTRTVRKNYELLIEKMNSE